MWRSQELRTLLDNTSAVIYVKDASGKYVLVNQHWEKRYHRTGQSDYGKTDYDIWPHEFAEKNHTTDKMVLELGGRLELEESWAAPEGPHHLQTVKFAMKNIAGPPKHMCSISTDITETRRIDESLRASEEQARIIIESARDSAIFSMDPEGHITSWNPGAEKIKGYKTHEILGQHFRIFYLPEQQEAQEPERHLKEAREHGTSDYEGVRIKKDGTKFFANMSLSVMRVNGEFRGFVKVVRDVTEKQEVQNQLRAAKNELERRIEERTAELKAINNELEAFAYSLAHDLRAPVRSIRGFSQALANDIEAHLNAESRDSLARIEKAATQMDTMIEDLLGYSRLSSSEIAFELVPMSGVMEEVQQQLAFQIRESQAEIQVADKLPMVWAHRPMLLQIFSNLLQNSIKFVEPGVKPRIQIEAESNGERAIIYVKDNGIGIAPNVQEKLFRLFERGHNSKRYQGTGIGLAMVRKAVERMGGRVGVKSEEHHGCCIWVELPVAERKSLAKNGSETRAKQLPCPSGKSKEVSAPRNGDLARQ